MPSELLQRLAEEVKQLSPEEQGELKKQLERSLADEVTRRLVAKGLMSRLPTPPSEADLERIQNWQPIAIQGKPLSETVIEDRR